MASQSNLDRLYEMLEEKTGITRIRDVRLEKIAADRALEMRLHQGLIYNPNNPIEHEMLQVRARSFPWMTDDRATENAAWHYYPPNWVDPIQGAIEWTFPDDPEVYGDLAGQSVGWWNSTPHRSQLMDTSYTHWGHGIHFEDTSLGARRWYFITVFAQPMAPLTTRTVTLLADQHIGYHLTADGQVIHKQYTKLTSPTPATVDDRMQVPGRGPMIHLTGGKPMNTRWVSDNEKVIW